MIAYKPTVPTSPPAAGKRTAHTLTMLASIDAPVLLPHMGATVLANPLPLTAAQPQQPLTFLYAQETTLRYGGRGAAAVHQGHQLHP
jgi:hypothetical protein